MVNRSGERQIHTKGTTFTDDEDTSAAVEQDVPGHFDATSATMVAPVSPHHLSPRSSVAA
jgi:hypothetical protein